MTGISKICDGEDILNLGYIKEKISEDLFVSHNYLKLLVQADKTSNKKAKCWNDSERYFDGTYITNTNIVIIRLQIVKYYGWLSE